MEGVRARAEARADNGVGGARIRVIWMVLGRVGIFNSIYFHPTFYGRIMGVVLLLLMIFFMISYEYVFDPYLCTR
jgi:membrane-bound ClpP family serine protease